MGPQLVAWVLTARQEYKTKKQAGMKSVAGRVHTQGRGPGALGEAAAEVRVLPWDWLCGHSYRHEIVGSGTEATQAS